MFMSLTVSVMVVVLVMITVQITRACAGPSKDTDRLPDELQQIDFYPAPNLRL
jgi:hypothetical protein